MRQNPHVRICGGPGSATTLVYPTGSYHDVVRRYFMDRARAGGYDVIDMQPVFVEHYRSHEEPFNWTRDAHWNALGHGLCADQVGRSQVLHRFAALETER